MQSRAAVADARSRVRGLPALARELGATSLIDGGTSTLWLVPTAGGPMKRVTDFSERTVVIARSVSWSADSQFLYAAVADVQTDIVLLDGLLG